MAEWFKAHAWKACEGLRLPRVRIPLSPHKTNWSDAPAFGQYCFTVEERFERRSPAERDESGS
jgi:hypothetical protein